MELQEILRKLEFNTGAFPREAIVEAIARKDQIIPALLDIVEDAQRDIQKGSDKKGFMAHIYAMFLLAYFREKRSYPLIVDFFSIPGEPALDVTGDVVTEYLGRILASVCHGDSNLIENLVENEEANEFVRDAALRGLAALVACEVTTREEVMGYFKTLFHGKLERTPSYVWTGLVICCTDLYPEEVLEDIHQAFKDGLVAKRSIGYETVTRQMMLEKTKVLRNLKQNRHYHLMGNTVDEMGWWHCFKVPERQVVNKKIGRNAPCPCGSGRKRKRCCGAV